MFFLLCDEPIPPYCVPSDNPTPSRWTPDGSAIWDYDDELVSVDFDYLSYGRAWIQVDVPKAVEDMAAKVFRAMMRNPHDLWLKDSRFGFYVDRFLLEAKPDHLLVFIRNQFIITRDHAIKIAVRLNLKPPFLFPTLTKDDSLALLREVKPELLFAFDFYIGLLDKHAKKEKCKEAFLSYVQENCKHFSADCFQKVSYEKDTVNKKEKHRFIGLTIGEFLRIKKMPSLGNENQRMKEFNSL